MALVSVLVTIAIFGLIVVVHEFGHFIVAKRNGILVEEFAVGMGPKIYGKVKGETLYSIRAFPVGGFCKMLSEEKEDAKGRSFGSKSVLQRMAVCVAGAVMNLVLAFVIIFFIASFGASEMPVVGIPTNTIDFVAEDTPASRAGLMFGDRIISYNGEEINNQADMNRAVRDFGTNQALIEIERNGERLNLEITPVVMGEGDNAFPRVGISLGSKIGVFERDNFNGAFDRAGFGETVASSFRATSLYTRLIIGSVIDLVTFNVSADDISGPIGVGQFIGSEITTSMERSGVFVTIIRLLNIAALLSANLAVFNLLPLPALDGGRLIFLIVEAVRRKPVPQEKEGIIHFVGMALLLVLAAFIGFRDILNFF